MTLAVRRVGRLVRARSPRLAVTALRREASIRRAEAKLARAARRGEPILAGPYLGEVGYELAYWIPFLRRVCREYGILPQRMTVLSRGGAGAWYADFAAREVDVLDLLDPEQYRTGLLARRARSGDAKQLELDRFDRELATAACERIGGAHVLHPRMMYARLRFLWEGLLPLEEAVQLADYAGLRVDDPERGDHIAVKLYSNEVFPETDAARTFALSLVERLAREGEVVMLAMDAPLDEHREWRAPGVTTPRLDPRRNLAEQTRLVAGARAFVCTYGGFSYLGPFVGTPTLAFGANEPDNPFHLDLMRAVNPGVDYEVAAIGEHAAVERFLARTAAGARA